MYVSRSVPLVASALALAVIVAPSIVRPVAAHFGSSAYIIVTADHVLPGQEFEVVAADLTPGASVSFRIVYNELSIPIASTTAPPDGHFNLRMSVPADFPSGDYAQLFATAGDGTEVSTWVLVGARTSVTPPRPGSGPWWSDPSVLVLGALVIGSIALVAWMVVRRSRRPAPAPARAAVTKSQRRRRKA